MSYAEKYASIILGADNKAEKAGEIRQTITQLFPKAEENEQLLRQITKEIERESSEPELLDVGDEQLNELVAILMGNRLAAE